MKLYNYILPIFIFLLGMTSCEDDLGVGNSQGEGLTEGMVTIHLTSDKGTDIITRANECPDCNDQEAIENVMLMIFKADATSSDSVLVNMAYQELIEDNNSVSIYMTAVEGQRLYALCNLPGDVVEELQEAEAGVYTLSQLREQVIEIDQPDGAFTGRYIMTGNTPIELEGGNLLKKDYSVCVSRLVANLNFTITFNPATAGDKFLISGVYIHNIPAGSMLLETVQSNSLEAGKDYAGKTDGKYFNLRLDSDVDSYDGSEGLWLDYSETMADTYTASFQMFENRQGGLDEENSTKDYWSSLSSLEGEKDENGNDLYKKYQQIKKRELAIDEGFQHATYITIHGVYQDAGTSLAQEVTYFVYLGADNYKDYNICRNHNYIYEITIYDVDKTDTRVLSNYLDHVTVYGNFDQILDAHPNVTQALLYSPNAWKVRVANPDETPWLEVSTSARYIPNIAGQHKADAATFTLEGNGGLQYFYIHTDEFVPYQEKPGEILSPQTNYPDSKSPYRTGTIICESGEVEEKIEIKQYAAQLVICHINYDIHTMKEVLDTFYVERVLEQKNLSWGFDHYWSLITDDLIAAGQWDGLANTRRLYEAATQGDKYDIESAYPDGIPSDIALGYAINKNRDRNGDGKITYDEIVWYLPAANEMQAVYGHNKASGVSAEDAGDYYMDEGNVDKIVLDSDVTGNFHTSSPSVADPAGITPGRSYYVDMSSGKKAIGLRSRRYNVLCARRKPGFFGNPNENTGVGGSVGNNPNWNEDEEQIMDKGK